MEFDIPLEVGMDEEALARFVLESAGAPKGKVAWIQKRSIDARGGKVKLKVRAEIVDEIPDFLFHYQDVSQSKPILIVGAGPAGIFAALRLIELGLKPIVLERGKNVRDRRRDLAAINKDQVVNPNSNYCFGEGGAGTYSDGKLYTRSNKRGSIERILQIFVNMPDSK